MGKLWADNETDLLCTEMCDSEIAERIGRTIIAVRRKRYKTLGHYVEESKQRDKINNKAIPEPMSDSTKEARILTLAKEMRIRLQG